MGATEKYINIGTFLDPSKIGIVQFKSLASKFGFLRRTNSTQTKWTNGSDMRFKSNDTVEKRTADKTLGFIKYHLHETKKQPLASIVIKWKKNAVEVNGKLAASVSDIGEVTYEHEFMDVKPAVEKAMTEWKAKRGLQ